MTASLIPMRALTVWQPWASLIIAEAKPFEFRKWRMPRALIGQRIVIHAAARSIDRAEVERLYAILVRRDRNEDYRRLAATLCLHAELAIPVLEAALDGKLPIAAGIGTAVVGESVYGLDVAERFGVPRVNDSSRDEHANWGWPLTDIEPWPQPVPMRGYQGFWTWPTAAQLLDEPQAGQERAA